MNYLAVIKPPQAPSRHEALRPFRLPAPVRPKRYGRFKTHPKDIVDAAVHVARRYGISEFAPTGRGERGTQLRCTNLAVLIRWAAIKVLIEKCDGITATRIGELIGRDHSSVVHARQRLDASPDCIEPYRTMILEALECARVTG